MILSYCFQEIHSEYKNGDRTDVMPPCQSIADFERWRINIFDRLVADPDYDENEDPYDNLRKVRRTVDSENFHGVLDSLNDDEKERVKRSD